MITEKKSLSKLFSPTNSLYKMCINKNKAYFLHCRDASKSPPFFMQKMMRGGDTRNGPSRFAFAAEYFPRNNDIYN